MSRRPGLHFDDVRKLLEVLHRLADLGNTVIIIEHNLDVIRNADWIIDLGPEGGEDGGRMVGEGPAQIAATAGWYTGQFLQRYYTSSNWKLARWSWRRVATDMRHSDELRRCLKKRAECARSGIRKGKRAQKAHLPKKTSAATARKPRPPAAVKAAGAKPRPAYQEDRPGMSPEPEPPDR